MEGAIRVSQFLKKERILPIHPTTAQLASLAVLEKFWNVCKIISSIYEHNPIIGIPNIAKDHCGYTNRPTITRPAGVRARESLTPLECDNLDILPLNNYEIPPWLLSKVSMRLDLTALPKNETAPVIYRQLFLEIISEFPQSTILYTDGSKTATGVGCALSVENEIHTWSLSSCASIYTAELYAIWQALLSSSMTRDKQKIIIVCDSLSVLQSISNLFSEDPLVRMIRLSIHDLHNNGRNVTFIWAPSHIGIVGNEIADIAGRNAAEAEEVEARILRADDVK
ncbi:hypothetical protein JTB14_014017 [Gonioctena quinquepunctata]|nr:hypothetical protein JTB14_014017 [Gonioctena quinquepunctata]